VPDPAIIHYKVRMTKSFSLVIGGADLTRRSRMTTIAAAVSLGSSRLLKSTFRPDFDTNGMHIIRDQEFGFSKETLVARRAQWLRS
jgi:hypothetical protein